MMISYDECLAFADLTEDEVEAIAEHEGLTEVAALELGAHLLSMPDGFRRIAEIIRDDIAVARSRHDSVRIVHLKRALAHLLRHHPERQTAS